MPPLLSAAGSVLLRGGFDVSSSALKAQEPVFRRDSKVEQNDEAASLFLMPADPEALIRCFKSSSPSELMIFS